jgi:hypothetical protein
MVARTMTHSLHRLGTEDSLKGDYVFLCTPAKGINDEGSTLKLIRILEILLGVGPTNIGFYGHGSLMDDIHIEDIKKSIHDNFRLRCCFHDREKLGEVLQIIKNEDLGLSITVSGLLSELKDICEELDLKPHTINMSCGIFGRTDLLPRREILEISTMCGHGMISHRLLEIIIKRLQEGNLDMDEAIYQLGKPCTCGIFNPSRAGNIIEDIIKNDTAK